MNRSDIELLQSIRGYPALSLMLPTHRTAPDNRQDPIRVKNLMTEAANRLLSEFSKREVDPILTRLDAIADEINYQHTLDGLAIFVNNDFARKFYLPFEIRQRVIIDETFATRDLVMAMNRAQRYWVLALSEKPTRLFEGARDALVEVENEDFPMTYTGPGVSSPMPGGAGVNKSAYRDERHRQFFRQIDEAFGKLVKDDPLPLVIVGVVDYLAFFNEVSSHRNLIAAEVQGNHDKTAPHDLAALVWPEIKETMHARRHEILDDLNAAVGARRSVSGVGECWRKAQEGRVDTLVVEEDFHKAARLGENNTVIPADDPSAADTIDDIVDELVEAVMEKGGRVVFVDNGTLDLHQRVAAILRY